MHLHHQQYQYDHVECIRVTLTRSPFCGFGFAISNETCNHSKNDQNDLHHRHHSLIISDVIRNGPADGKLLTDDRIIEVNGHPVVDQMEEFTLNLIRQSTDFVHLTIERSKSSMKVVEKLFPIEYILDPTVEGEKFGLVLACEYFIQQVPSGFNQDINRGDEVIQVNNTPIEHLSLEEAQRLIDTTPDQLILYTKPRRKEETKEKTGSLSTYQSQYHPYPFKHSNPSPSSHSEKRCLSFFINGSNIGIRVVGGNKYGLFVGELQTDSVAQQAGLMVADKIFRVNQWDFTHLTREEAVLHLMSMKSCQVTVTVANLPQDYETLLNDVGGDSFYIRSRFNYQPSTSDQYLPIRINDIFHVTNTLHEDQVGAWTARKVNTTESVIGVIPNQSRAEQVMNVAVTLDKLIKMKQASSKGTLKSKLIEKKLKSYQTLNQSKDDSFFGKIQCWKPTIMSKGLAYERVELKPTTIIRPVVLLGPLADIARDRLLDDYPDQFELPDLHLQSINKRQRDIIKIASLQSVIQKNRHCLLDIAPSAIEQLNEAQCYPIVIFLKVSHRQDIKQIRQQYGKLYQKSSRVLWDIAERLELFYSYLFTSMVEVDGSKNWLAAVKSQIDFQQEQSIWMSKDRSTKEEPVKPDDYFLLTKIDSFDEIFRQDPSSREVHGREKEKLQRVASDSVLSSHGQGPDQNGSSSMSHDSITTRSISSAQIKAITEGHTLSPNSTALSNDRFYHPSKKTDRSARQIPIEFLVGSNQQKPNAPFPDTTLQNGSIRKNVRDQGTMTDGDQRSTPDLLYATWNGSHTRSGRPRPTILPNLTVTQKLLRKPENPIRCSSNIKPHVSMETVFVRPDLLKHQPHPKSTDPAESVLHKPRVYGFDHRKEYGQEHAISTSSSGSSIRSIKLADIREVPETRSLSGDEGYELIGGARSIINCDGGQLFCSGTGITLTIPKNAIPEGIQQEIYFQVYQTTSSIPTSNPIIICGPPGIQFREPVKLLLPHSTSHDPDHVSLLIDGVHYYSKNHQTMAKKDGTHHLFNSNASILGQQF